jgi:septal ring factor EnvC (AmiA/AmiB activator)
VQKPDSIQSSHFYKLVFSLLIGLFVLSNLHAQKKDKTNSLKSKKVLLQDEIEIANQILEETKSTREVSVGQVTALNQKIAIRSRLIRTINKEVKLFNEEIEETKSEIAELEKELETLKEEYAEMIVNAYKSRDRNSKLMYILASEDMEQAFKRLQYFQEYSEYRNKQGEVITKKQAELEEQIEALKKQKQAKQLLLVEKNKEREKLQQEKIEQQQTVNQLLGKEGEIKKEIAAKQKEVNRLEAEIQKIIAEEMRRSREKAERGLLIAEAKRLGLKSGSDFNSKTANKKLRVLIDKKKKEINKAGGNESMEEANVPSYGLTPEAKKLAAGFTANKGNLPWPVEKGIVVGKYGKQPHPVAKGVIENRPHVEIATANNSEARAVYGGTVSRVFRVQGAGIAVIVSHGNYFTVYSNLSEVYVKRGQELDTKEKIGKIYTNPSTKQTVLEFGLWLNDKSQDPQVWLFR